MQVKDLLKTKSPATVVTLFDSYGFVKEDTLQQLAKGKFASKTVKNTTALNNSTLGVEVYEVCGR